MPAWVKVAIDAWTAASGVAASHVFRPVNRGGAVTGDRLGEKVVWQMLKRYAAAAGAFLASHPMICGAHAPNCAGRLAANLSRSNCCLATLPFRPPSDTSEHGRTWFTLRMMRYG